MIITVEYMGLKVHINKNTKEITIIENNNNSKKLSSMVFKAILHNINININDYKTINES